LGSSNLSLIAPGSDILPQPRNLTDNGRLFFESRDALSPHDTNGRVQDVYEYEPDGVGTCESEAENGGCISLISSGRDTTDSDFVNATPSGSDVFFTTRSRLVSSDEDNLIDLYDARENGGFPPPASVPPCTTADSCRAAPSPQPTIFGAPSSQTFTGAGNIPSPPAVVKPKPKSKAAKCRKGFVKKNRKCIKKPKPKNKKTKTKKVGRDRRTKS
jgi:hypothetical protein